MNRDHDTDALAAAVWAAAEGHASTDQLARIDTDRQQSLRIVEDLLAETQTRLESVQGLRGPERAQVIADFAEELEGLRRVRVRLDVSGKQSAPRARPQPAGREEPVGLQASWADGELVVWAGGSTGATETNDELADRLEALDGPKLGWRQHRGVPLDHGRTAEAVSIPVADALGWLVAVGAGGHRD